MVWLIKTIVIGLCGHSCFDGKEFNYREFLSASVSLLVNIIVWLVTNTKLGLR